MQTLFHLFWRLLGVIICALLAFMIVLVFTNVVLRYGFASGLRASVELSRMAFVWVILLGAALTLHRREHLSVDEFMPAVAPKLLPVTSRLVYVVILVTAGMLVIGAWRQMMSDWADISPLTGLPSALFYVPGVISGVAMSATAINRIIDPSRGGPQS